MCFAVFVKIVRFFYFHLILHKNPSTVDKLQALDRFSILL